MAAVTLLGQLFNTNSGTQTVTATPAVNDLIVIVTAHTGNTSAAAPTDDQSGTYTEITSAVKATSADTMRVFIRTALIPSAVSTVFTHAPGTSTGGGLVVLKVTGMSKTGATAARQSAKQDNTAAATPAPTFASACLTGNAVIGAVFSSTAAMNPPTNYTEQSDSNYLTPTTGLETVSRDSGETGTTITWGSATTTEFGSLVVELDTSAPGATLTAESGSFTLTGTAVGLLRGYVMAADAASFTLTGTAAGLLRAYIMAADAAAFVLTGTDAALRRGYALIADAGSFVLTGAATGLLRGYVMAADAASFVLTGTEALLRRAFTMVAEAGAFVLSFTDILTNKDRAYLRGRRRRRKLIDYGMVIKNRVGR